MSEEVFFSPITSIHSNDSPGTLVVGRPGGGKSFALLNIAANSLESGCRVFALDAKNDLVPLKRLFPEIKVTDLSNVERVPAGALDPFLVFEEVDATIILTIVELLCGALSSEQKLAVTPIIGDYVRRVSDKTSRETFRDFADYLYQHELKEAQTIGNQLLLSANSKYGKVIFGEPGRTSRALKFGNESRVISILGMSLPTDYSSARPDELLNGAIVYIICKLLGDILTQKTSDKKSTDKIPNVVVFDECHMLFRSKAISNVITDLLVLGRSLGAAVCLASQNVTHFDQSIAQHISTKITFKMTKKEAEEFLELFDNSSSSKEIERAEVLEIITRLKTGYCVMIDRLSRIALVHITSNYDITSNPLFKKEEEIEEEKKIKFG